jgi:hypothetical protein
MIISISLPTPLPKYRPLEDYKIKGNTVDYDNEDEDVPHPLLKHICAVPDPETNYDNDPPSLRRRRYDDSSSDDASDDDDGSPPLTRHEYNEDGQVSRSTPVVQRKPTRRDFIKHAFIEAAKLSRDLSPLSPSDNH